MTLDNINPTQPNCPSCGAVTRWGGIGYRCESCNLDVIDNN